VAQLYSRALGFPFSRLLRQAGVRWGYSSPPLHGEYLTNSDNKITDVEIREVGDNRLGEVLHSGGQSGNCRGSKEFLYNRYHGYQG
jgi:hypothetical protein